MHLRTVISTILVLSAIHIKFAVSIPTIAYEYVDDVAQASHASIGMACLDQNDNVTT